MVLKPSDFRVPEVYADWCPGCGDFGIMNGLQMAFAELGLEPYQIVMVSGIGCSGKEPHNVKCNGVHTLHGRTLPFAMGIKVANPALEVVAIGGDGDGLGIGAGHFVNAGRRNLDMTYIIHNNGVYGLTKGQFSASADPGSTAKKGEANTMQAIDSVLLALTLGATFVARSFSGDKAQLVPILKAGLAHRGFAFIDVISPCVTFNDHEGSTKSYAHTREHKVEVVQADFVPPREEITTDYAEGTLQNVMLHDGSWVKLRKLAHDYDPTDRDKAYAHIRESQKKNEVVTGLLYISSDSKDVHDQNETVAAPLYNLPHEQLCPGNDALQKLMGQFR